MVDPRVPPAAHAKAKRALRLKLREQLRALSAAERERRSAAACAAWLHAPEVAAAELVFAFVSMPWEIDSRPLLQGLLRAGKRLAVPRVRSAEALDAVAIERLDALQPGTWGILEPAHGEIVPPTAIDAVACPGLGFSAAGDRLGQGGGHYDRYLANLRPDAWLCGLAFDLQRLATLPVAPHDVRVPAVATESGVHRTAPPAVG